MTGIIILAAGSSSRLGQPKQLVPWQGIPLIRHAAITAIEANLGPVAVVLGAVVEPCRNALEGLDLIIAENPAWESGMGSSIACGMASLTSHDLENVIVTLCDLPLLTPAVFRKLLALRLSEKTEVIASHNGNTLAPPILFSQNRFPFLKSLTGPEGARSLLRNKASITAMNCPESNADIDTPADLAKSKFWETKKQPRKIVKLREPN